MKRDKNSIRKTLSQYFSRYGEPSQEDVAFAVEHVWQRLEPEVVHSPVVAALKREPRIAWPLVAGLAAAAAVVLVVLLQMSRGIDAHAVVESADGSLSRISGDKTQIVHTGERIEAEELLRTNDANGSIALADGSRVELRSQSEFLMERAEDGVRIHLFKGGLIINAAKQVAGHLYVQTKDVTVSVVGTVFLVNAEEEGSRVAVIEGEVRVKQGETEKSLRPGEQVTTNPKMESLPVKEEIAWSRHVETHLVLLEQAAATTSVVGTQAREAFEVESIRRYNPPLTGGRGGRVWAIQGCGGDPEVNPKRFAVSGATLYTLMVWAYSTPEFPVLDCRGYTALNLISGGPDWIQSDQWDVQAIIPDGFPAYTAQQLRRSEAPKLQGMLRTMLEDRFGVVIRREKKEVQAYALVSGRDATNPAPTDIPAWLSAKPENWQPYAPGTVGDERGPTGPSREWSGYFTGSEASMSDLVQWLGQKTGRPIVDRTGLMGRYNWYVVHPVEPPPNNSPVVGVLNPSDRSFLFKALEQLGLKVQDTRAPVEIVVIDRVQKPSPN